MPDLHPGLRLGLENAQADGSSITVTPRVAKDSVCMGSRIVDRVQDIFNA
jgi:hypothetical protein